MRVFFNFSGIHFKKHKEIEKKGRVWKIILFNTFHRGPFTGKNSLQNDLLCKVNTVFPSSVFFPLLCHMHTCSFIHQKHHNRSHKNYHLPSPLQLTTAHVEMK